MSSNTQSPRGQYAQRQRELWIAEAKWKWAEWRDASDVGTLEKVYEVAKKALEAVQCSQKKVEWLNNEVIAVYENLERPKAFIVFTTAWEPLKYSPGICVEEFGEIAENCTDGKRVFNPFAKYRFGVAAEMYEKHLASQQFWRRIVIYGCLALVGGLLLSRLVSRKSGGWRFLGLGGGARFGGSLPPQSVRRVFWGR
jgi:hypothetical protein